MTFEQQYILQVLSAALHGEHWGVPEQLDWATFLSETRRQGVSALCYFSVDRSNLPYETRIKWEQIAYLESAVNLQVINAHVGVCKLLEERGIPTVCLKGYASAFYYPHPHLRSMGDVDFYIEEDYRTKARTVLTSNGYQEIDLNRHHDWLYQKAGISYELHFAISGVPRGKDGEPFLVELASLVADRQWIEHKIGLIAIPSDYHHGLIILLHTASHIMSGGIGLRHLCDWAAFVNHFEEDEFQDLFKASFEKLRVWRFAQTLTAVCEKYLGLKKQNWVKGVEDATVDKLLDEFLSSGDYSKDREFRQSDLMASEGFSVRVGRGSQIKNMMGVLRNNVELRWPITQSNRILLIVGMVYSAVRYALRVLMGKREKLRLVDMSREASERRKLYQSFGLIEGNDE